jgi:23S rRNA (uracil1939-C5)-methyltransferase
MNPYIENLTVEKLVFGGQGLARHNGKVVMVWNALPGEVVNAQVLKRKRNYLEAVAKEIIKSAPERIQHQEDHFLSCSPWQILNEAGETEWKKKVALETYRSIGGIELPEIEIAGSPEQLHYRNKMEFSFTESNGAVSLAFFRRASRYQKAIDGCVLARPEINAAATRVVEWLNSQDVKAVDLKSLIIRTSGERTIAGLFVMKKAGLTPPQIPGLDAFHIYYSDPRSPASLPSEIIASYGEPALREKILGRTLEYGLFSFFQVNLPVFEMALRDIEKFLLPDLPLLDFYSGVGAVSIALADRVTSAQLVESSEEAIYYAKKNIAQNTLKNFTTTVAPAEKTLERITPDSQLLLDPPRPGLHPKVIDTILAKPPKRIAYLSCNISTQARDLALLKAGYHASFYKLYNFFPRTPHLEGLCLLERNV